MLLNVNMEFIAALFEYNTLIHMDIIASFRHFETIVR